MNLGFTGTQRGLTQRQYARLAEHLSRFVKSAQGVVTEFHHGDCIGADAQAGALALARGYHVVLHPPDNPIKRAWSAHHVMLDPLPYLERNHAIVTQTQHLIACPGETTEQLRSGTWSTVRYARKLKRPITIILPSGAIV